MHADPVAHAAEHFAKVDAYQEAMEKEENRLRLEFIHAATTKTLTDKAGFGTTMAKTGTAWVRVEASVLDVLQDAMDYRANDGVVFNALVLCAKKGDVDALAALHKLADTYAELHAEVQE